MALRKKSRKANNKNKNKRIRKSRRNRRKVGGGGFRVGQKVYYKKKYYDNIHLTSITHIDYNVQYKITNVNAGDTYNIKCENSSDLSTFNNYISRINSEIKESNTNIRITDSGPEVLNPSTETIDPLLKNIENVPSSDLTLVPNVHRKVIKKET